MRRALTIALAATLALVACKKSEPADEDLVGRTGHGSRYVGIGIYSINELWKQLVQQEPPKGAPPRNPQSAVLADDTEIIVTVDSHTGEVRQCGNYSGYCVSSNPWKVAAASSPAALTKHAADFDREREEKQRELEAKIQTTTRKH